MNDNKNNASVELDEVKLQETILRVIKDEGSEEDNNFIKDLEKLIGEPVIGEKSRMLGEKIKANKMAMARIQSETKSKLAKNDDEYHDKLRKLDKLQFETERKARSRGIVRRLVLGLIALVVISWITSMFGVTQGLFTLGFFAVIFYAFKK